MLSCKCLNVIIETESRDFEVVTPMSLALSEEERNYAFFKQEFQQVKKLLNINKAHAGLVQTRTVGSWIVHCCINCDVHTHAFHREKGASCVLVSCNLLRENDIEILRSSELYSQTFNIVIRDLDEKEDSQQIDSYSPKEIQSLLRNLKEISNEKLKNESLAVEERVKRFSEQQYMELENLKDKTFREQEALIRLILSKTTGKSNVPDQMSNMSHPSTPTKTDSSTRSFNFKADTENAKVELRYTPQRQKSNPGFKTNSVDSEVLFDFDELGSAHTPQTSEDESDTEVPEEIVKIPRGRSASLNLAKSLPMNIPTFMSQFSNHDNEDLDSLPLEENVDIAASIKALAQSVHGDAIFGDLPRPRFSTQI